MWIDNYLCDISTWSFNGYFKCNMSRIDFFLPISKRLETLQGFPPRHFSWFSVSLEYRCTRLLLRFCSNTTSLINYVHLMLRLELWLSSKSSGVKCLVALLVNGGTFKKWGLVWVRTPGACPWRHDDKTWHLLLYSLTYGDQTPLPSTITIMHCAVPLCCAMGPEQWYQG